MQRCADSYSDGALPNPRSLIDHARQRAGEAGSPSNPPPACGGLKRDLGCDDVRMHLSMDNNRALLDLG